MVDENGPGNKARRVWPTFGTRKASDAHGPLVHRYFLPDERLSTHVSWYWATTGDDRRRQEKIRVLPDGCMDIVFDLGGGLAPQGEAPSAFVTGVSTTPEIIVLPHSPRILGVHLTPFGASSLLGVRAQELAGRHTPLTDLLPNLAREAMDRLRGAHRIASAKDILDQLLIDRLQRVDQANALVAHAVRAMRFESPTLRIANLARTMGVSHKRLERTFRSHVGLPPKRFAKIMRFVDAAQALQRSAPPPLANLALDLGYSDQSHFNRDFKALAGLAPNRWLAEQTSVDFLQYAPVTLR